MRSTGKAHALLQDEQKPSLFLLVEHLTRYDPTSHCV